MASPTVTYGAIKEFDSNVETITTYLERLQLYFAVNNVAEERKVPVLLMVIGPKVYMLLRGLLDLTLPKEKSYADLEKALTDHYEPKPLIIAERFNFYKREQAAGESLTDYQAELRCLARTCEFGSFLNEALRDCLVVGMRSESIQRRLLTEANLTLAKALEKRSGDGGCHR